MDFWIQRHPSGQGAMDITPSFIDIRCTLDLAASGHSPAGGGRLIAAAD